MFLARMREPRGRRRVPLRELTCPRSRIWIRHGLREPCLELIRYGSGRRRHAQRAQIVIAQATADDQHAFVAQRSKRCTHAQMLDRGKIRAQRKRDDGNLRLRIHHRERHEGAVIEASLGIFVDRNPRAFEQLRNACGNRA